MKRILFLVSTITFICVCTCFFIGCKKWTDAKALTVQKTDADSTNNDPRYQQYLQNLKNYKDYAHPLIIGWFTNWTTNNSLQNSFLKNLPDSLDMVCIVKPDSSLSGDQVRDMQTLQQQKGTRVLLTVDMHSMSDSILAIGNPNASDNSDAIIAYANTVIKQVQQYNYDGIDLVFEGNSCASCASLFKDPQNVSTLIKTLSAVVGLKSGTNKLFLLEGDANYLPAGTGYNFNYFIANTSTATWYFQISSIYEGFKDVEGFTSDKFIVMTSFDDKNVWPNGGINFNSLDGTISPASLAMAKWNTPDGIKGGEGIYSIQNDYYNSDYQFSRQIIQILNPSVQ